LYLKDISRGQAIERQLSMPVSAADRARAEAAKPKETATTPQPEDPLQINMPTPTSAILVAPSVPAVAPYTMPAVPATMTSPAGATPPQQPQFAYADIHVNNPNGLKDRIFINEQV